MKQTVPSSRLCNFYCSALEQPNMPCRKMPVQSPSVCKAVGLLADTPQGQSGSFLCAGSFEKTLRNPLKFRPLMTLAPRPGHRLSLNQGAEHFLDLVLKYVHEWTGPRWLRGSVHNQHVTGKPGATPTCTHWLSSHTLDPTGNAVSNGNVEF